MFVCPRMNLRSKWQGLLHVKICLANTGRKQSGCVVKVCIFNSEIKKMSVASLPRMNGNETLRVHLQLWAAIKCLPLNVYSYYH